MSDKFEVVREHVGDKHYFPGDLRVIKKAEVAHLVPHVLIPASDVFLGKLKEQADAEAAPAEQEGTDPAEPVGTDDADDEQGGDDTDEETGSNDADGGPAQTIATQGTPLTRALRGGKKR